MSCILAKFDIKIPLMLAELGELSQIIELDKDLENPKSKICLERALKILDLISNNTAAFYDSSICDKSFDLSIFDSVNMEYKLHNGSEIFIVPRSVILGATLEVRKRKYKPTGLFEEFLCITAKIAADLVNKLDNKTKFKWREDGTATIQNLTSILEDYMLE